MGISVRPVYDGACPERVMLPLVALMSWFSASARAADPPDSPGTSEPLPTAPPHPITPRHTPFGTAPVPGVGQIEGTVLDDGERAQAGALVTLGSPALPGGARQVTTDDRGSYRFEELSPGIYEVLAQMEGFNISRRLGVEVRAGLTTHVTIEMTSGNHMVEVVGGRAVIDTTGCEDCLAKVPTGRSYEDAVQQVLELLGAQGPGEVVYAVTVDTDSPIRQIDLTCGGARQSRTLARPMASVQFSAIPGACTVTVEGGGPLSAQVVVPGAGGAARCVLRAGTFTCE